MLLVLFHLSVCLVAVHDQIGNGRFGEVRKAEVTNICEESPLQNIACIKVFQGNETTLRLRLFLLLISTELQTGHCLRFCVYVCMYVCRVSIERDAEG